jgi:hypothetical protein
MSPIDPNDEYAATRDKRTTGERLELLERDTRSLARQHTAFVEAGKSFSKEQMEQIRVAFREEISDAGLRIDGPDHVQQAREDFRFVRKLRLGVDGYASKIGWLFIAAIVGAAIWLFTLGVNTWRGS